MSTETDYTEDYFWFTEEFHYDNTETMSDYLNYHMNPDWELVYCDGCYVEVLTEDKVRLSLNAFGAGDSNNHLVEIRVMV
jgi:hypothetical protein